MHPTAARAPRGSAAGRVRLGALVAVVLVVAACGDEEIVQRQPVAPDDGIVITGRYAGQTLSVTDGEPEVVVGDCDRGDGVDRDLCIVTRTIDGARLGLVLENPDALQAGSRLPVRGDACTTCDDVADHAVVDVRSDGPPRRASGGSLEVDMAGPRYVASFRLRFPDGGELTGRFNVRPPPVPP